MKKLILLTSMTFVVSSCKRNEARPQEEKPPLVIVDSFPIIKTDTLRIDLGYQHKYDSLMIVSFRKDLKIDSLYSDNQKLAKDLLHKKLIIKNAQYYLNITVKNPKQDKFLKGWMRRALYQETK
ncbi:putative peptidoglycan-binding domain-containing protein [Chryseobacterium sp. KACC 21268]|nr:putative peptidoglycan-binding domain-containing protein [Chryseobacterium sp. KACC 21268]